MIDAPMQRVEELFRTKFGSTPEAIVRSPGRVNLIGEHTDYNEGFVLPAAVDKGIYFAASPRNDRRFCFVSGDLHDELEGSFDDVHISSKSWANYLLGVVAQFQKAGYTFNGVDIAFGGDVPIGAGLSSSAAMEGGCAFVLNELFALGVDKLSMVRMAQKAEHEFAHVQCGIMDQFINIFGKNRKTLKIDCRSLAYEYIPFERDDVRIVLCETPTRRSLASSEYNTRRCQCEAGVAALQAYVPELRSLRDVDLDFLLEHRSDLDPVVFRRCEYVVRENARVLLACEDLQRSDLISFGQRLFDSHAGLRDDYEVSSKELDILVDIASGLDGVLGARMMGAGFGGCSINLVEESAADQFPETIGKIYREQTGSDVKIHTTKLVGGTERLR